MQDCIEFHKDFLSPKECQKVIDTFEHYNKLGLTVDRQSYHNQPKTKVSDDGMSINIHSVPHVTECANTFLHVEDLPKRIFEVVESYAKKYAIRNLTFIQDLKVQKTKPSEGYHVWHSEYDRDVQNRVLFYIIYLNEVEGGETEFLYQQKRVKPLTGSILIAPAFFTHTHRGNPPLDKPKYIITGWISS